MKKTKLTKRLWIIIILILVLCAGIFIHQNPHIIISSIRLFNPDYLNASITFEKADYYGFEKYGDKIVAAYRDSIVIYDDKLNAEQTISSAGSDPIVKTSGDNMIVFYPSDKKAVVKTNKEEKTINTGYYILNADITSNGYYAIITEEKGFKAQVAVYDKKGNEVYKWHSSDCYITDVDISDDGKMMVITELAPLENSFESRVMLFNFTDSKPLAQIVKNDTTVISAQFTDKRKIAIVGDTKSSVHNLDGSLIWEEAYPSKQLFTYNINGDNIILALGNTASATENVSVNVYSLSGNLKGQFHYNGEVLGIDIADNGILVYGKRSLYLISEGGREKRKLDLNVDIMQAFLLENEKSVFIVSNSVGKVYYLRW